MHIDKNDYPALGFKFKVTSTNSAGGLGGAVSNIPYDPDESFFQSVSGIGAELATTTVANGGYNNRQYQLPGATKYTNLTLSRGLLKSESPISKWVRDLLINDSNDYGIQLKTINVLLIENDAENKEQIMMSWSFYDCYPVGVELGAFNADKSEIALEKLTICYSQFTQNLQGKSSNPLNLLR
jgi:phage tail-like protein